MKKLTEKQIGILENLVDYNGTCCVETDVDDQDWDVLADSGLIVWERLDETECSLALTENGLRALAKIQGTSAEVTMAAIDELTGR